MGREFADVCECQVSVAAQNHRAQVAAAAKDAREVRGGKVVFVQEVSQDVPAFQLRPFHMLRVVSLNKRAKQVEVIALIGREVLVPQHHCVRDFGGVVVLRRVVNGAGQLARSGAGVLRYAQSGQYQTYGAIAFSGLVFTAIVVLVLSPL